VAHPLQPRRNGTRSAAVTLPRGRRFAFRYLAEDGRWHDDDTAGAVEPNGIGGYNAVIHTQQYGLDHHADQALVIAVGWSLS
jgi:hypothetical protein